TTMESQLKELLQRLRSSSWKMPEASQTQQPSQVVEETQEPEATSESRGSEDLEFEDAHEDQLVTLERQTQELQREILHLRKGKRAEHPNHSSNDVNARPSRESPLTFILPSSKRCHLLSPDDSGSN